MKWPWNFEADLDQFSTEVDEDKKLQGQHAIDEAMSTLLKPYADSLGAEFYFRSSRSHEELPEMSQR